MPYFTLFVVLCCAVFYYRLGEAEYDGGWLLASVSVVLWTMGLLVLHWGLLANLLLQAGIFVALWLWNVLFPKRP